MLGYALGWRYLDFVVSGHIGEVEDCLDWDVPTDGILVDLIEAMNDSCSSCWVCFLPEK